MWKLALKVAASIVVMIFTAILTASDTVQILNISARWLSLITLLIFAGLVYWAMYGLYRELHRIRTSVPRLLLCKVEPNIKDIAKIETAVVGGTPQSRLIGIPTFTRIWVCNKPTSPELGVDANNVHAAIEFRRRLSQDIVSMRGRWPEVEESHDNLKTEQITMPPNGKPFALDIVMKYPQDKEAYGYDNTAHRLLDGRNPNTSLGDGDYTVKVTLACKGVDLSLWFAMHNPGSGGDINFSLPTPDKEGSRN